MRILLVNLPAERGKRGHFGKLPFQHPTNYGLIAVGSSAASRGYEVSVFDPRVDRSAAAIAGDYESSFANTVSSQKWDLIGFSCISGFSYPTLAIWTDVAKQFSLGAFLIVGGQDHVGKMPRVTLAENPALDGVAVGEGESVILAVAQELNAGRRPRDCAGLITRDDSVVGAAATVTDPPALQYSLCNGFEQLPASVEFARGCPFACNFCVSAGSALRRRSPGALVEQIRHAIVEYGEPNLPLYLEAPIFVASRQYLVAFREALRLADIAPEWRAETRVDTISPSDAGLLWDCGMRVVDLGLETASPQMLSLMRKTRDPRGYLSSASALIAALSRAGIFVKVNILFYPGETPSTVAETQRFLAVHRRHIGAVAAYPLLMYPGIEGEATIRGILAEHGGSFVRDPEWTRCHLTPLNVSRHYRHADLLEVAHSLEQEFQDVEGYFYQRRFGYFSPRVTFDEFLESVSRLGADLFPFGID